MRFFLLLSLFLVAALALPFKPESGVIEATPKTFNGLLKTHKPVFIMIYAPWCGHCKAMHGDYEKFAKNMKGMARIIAINGDQHKELSSKFGVQGFPTIKYYGMGDKAKLKPQDYQGERKAGPLTKAAMNLVKNDFVINAKKISDLDAQLGKAESGKVAILVSNKGSVPPLWAVVAGSNQLSSAKFVFATDKQKDIVKALGATNFPTIAVVSKAEGSEEYSTSIYAGAVDYDGIAKFVLGELKGSSGASSTEEKTENEEGGKPAEKKAEKKAKEPSNPKPALPVKPTALTKYTVDMYCSNKAMKIKGQSPLCVIAANEARQLDAVHAKYAHEPVLFFYATEEEDVEKLSKAVGASIGSNDVLLLRSWKEKAKYAVMKGDEDLDGFLSRVLEGSVAFSKAESFPKL